MIVKKIIVLLSLIALMVSCDATNDFGLDFYNVKYRKGTWVNSDQNDTLEFVNSSSLIRKGGFYSESYLYTIEKDVLRIRLSESDLETLHPILIIQSNSIKLGNMYITTGMSDNSGTFYKSE